MLEEEMGGPGARLGLPSKDPPSQRAFALPSRPLGLPSCFYLQYAYHLLQSSAKVPDDLHQKRHLRA
jgi:hypothetical protein